MNERDIETIIDKKLSQLGWILDPKNPKRNVFKQNLKTKEENIKLKGKKPDYALYDNDNIIAIIEAKRPNKNLQDALNQGMEYAKLSQCNIVIAYDGSLFETSHLLFDNISLTKNENKIDDFLSLENLKHFKNDFNWNTLSKNKINSNDLIDIFKSIDNLLRNSGVTAGHERFSDFSSLVFIKLFYDNSKDDKWKKLVKLVNSGQDFNVNSIEYINNTILKELKKKYDDDDLFKNLNIRSENKIKEIINLLDEINFSEINSDIKGGAYEYFLARYNTGAKDLAQYYTPRHIINFMVKVIDPKIGNKIYDPFCGTGGMLITSYKHLEKKIYNEYQDSEELNNHINKLKKVSIFGQEFTSIASTAKMNMILAGDGHNNITRIDTFSKPVEKKYNIVLTNIPFGTETEYASLYGLQETKELKFLGEPSAIIHIIKSLIKDKSKAGVIVPTGLLYRVYNNDKKARNLLIQNGLRLIVNLPPGVFLPYTQAQTSILFLDNSKDNLKKDFISFFNVKNDGFSLSNQREKILETSDLDFFIRNYDYKKDFFEKHLDFIKYLKIQDIEKNKFNLWISDYDNEFIVSTKYENWTTLKEISSIFQGPAGCYLKKSIYSREGELKVYEQSHVIQKNFNIEKNRYITNKYNNSSVMAKGKYLIKENDILVTMSGTVGKIILVPKNIKKGIISTSLSIIRINNPNEYNPKFVELYLDHNPEIKTWFAKKTKGTANKGIRLETISNIFIPKLDIEKQIEIVNNFEKINKRIKEIFSEQEILKNQLKNYFN